MSNSRMLSGSPILLGDNTIPGVELPKEVMAVIPKIFEVCRKRGLDFYPTIVEKVTYDDMSEIAAYGGFPNRYPHWSFGMEYEELSRGYEFGLQRIYELVINCLAKTAPVLSERGTIFANDVKIGDLLLLNGESRKVVGVLNQPRSKIKKIKLGNYAYELECSQNHKWRVVDDKQGLIWKKASDIKIGDIVIGSNTFYKDKPAKLKWSIDNCILETRPNIRHRVKNINPPIRMTLELAELLGAIVGDGSCGVKGAENSVYVTVGKEEIQYIARIKYLFQKVFDVEVLVDEKPACFTVNVHSKAVVDFLDYLGLKKGSTFKTKRIPWSIQGSSCEFRAAFLRGLFDTDGYAYDVLGMSAYNRDLAQDVQLMLVEMGIYCTFKIDPNNDGFINVVEIQGQPSIKKFIDKIGFSIERKQLALRNMLNKQYCRSGGIKVPWLQQLLIKWADKEGITTYNYPSLGRSIKVMQRDLVGFNCLFSFVERAQKEFEFDIDQEIMNLIDLPMYKVESIEDLEEEQETIDIVLDHDDHDFVAYGLVTHNTNPCYIYCMDSNTLMDDVLVIAHALAHSDFFKNNIHFEQTDENMMNVLANHGTRIRQYIARWGKERVTEFIDHVMRINTLIDNTRAWKKRKFKSNISKDERRHYEPLRHKVEHDYMEPWINNKEHMNREKEMISRMEAADELELFGKPEKDIMAYLKDHAPLKPWQQDIIAMLYEEALYFAPQRLTKTLNEGWACIEGNSLIPTANGFIEIKDIVNDKMQLDVNDGDKNQKVSNWFKYEQRDTVKITTKHGYELKGSDNHRIYDSTKEWRQLRDFRIGDKVFIARGEGVWASDFLNLNFKPKVRVTIKDVCKTIGVDVSDYYKAKKGQKSASKKMALALSTMEQNAKEFNHDDILLSLCKEISVPHIVDEQLGAFLGYMIGDGHISKKKRVLGLTTGDDEQADEFCCLVKSLFNLEVNKFWDASSLNGRWRLSVYSKKLEHFLVHLGLTTGVSARFKEIPKCILRSPKEVMSSFLRAYFDSDGYAGSSGIILSTSSEKLGKQVQIVLNNYGILSSRKSNQDGTWHVSIRGKSSIIFRNEIGFGLTRKNDALNSYIQNHKFWVNEKEDDEIVSIEYGKDDVFDFTVDVSHKYSALGFINHNSYWDSEILCGEGLVSLGDKRHDCGIVAYALHKAGVLGGKYSSNPYALGYCLFRDIKDRWDKGKFGREYDECTDYNEKKKWNKKLGLGEEKIFEVRKFYSDVTALNEFFTPEFCEKYEFFHYKRYPNGEMKIESRDHKVIKKSLIDMYSNGGLPDIRLVDPNHRNKGWFLLEHRYDGKELHDPYVKETMLSLYYLWQKPVILTTILNGKETVYVCSGDVVSSMDRNDYENKGGVV